MSVETWGCGVRHIQLLLLLISRVVELNLLWTLRISLFLAERDATSNHTLFDDPYRQTVRAWSANQKGILNNSYLTLSFIANLLGGWLTLKVNLKWMLLVTVAINTIFTYAFPFICVSTNYDAVLALTITMGFLFMMKDPAIMAILAQWTPTGELARTVPLIYSSMSLSHFTLLFLYQFIKDSPASWSSIFYLMGNLGVLWCVGWYTFGFQEPDKCFYVSLRERNFIANNIPLNTFGHKKVEIPWKRMFKSAPFYGVLISTISFKWTLVQAMYSSLLMSYVNSYGIHYSFGLFFGYFFCLFLTPFFLLGMGFVSDKVVMMKRAPTRYARKTCNSIAFWGTTVTLLFLAYDTVVMVELALTGIYCFTASISYLSIQLNFFDVDRALTGFIYGLVNFFALIPIAYINSLFPLVFNPLPKLDDTINMQFDALWIAGALAAFFGNFVYICMATDETEPMVTVAPMAPRTSAFEMTKSK